MSFKPVEKFNQERYGGFFLLRNDGDFKDVIFLYQSVDDVLIADVHYIKSPDYTGYVHCSGRGCPACGKGIRVQTKLFIPIYDIESDEIVFFDRSSRFEQQFMSDVINKYPNPSEIVFRITRKGDAGSVDTKYVITAVAKNTTMSYASILASKGVTLPEHYDIVCKEYTSAQLHSMLNSGDSPSGEDLGAYQAQPRVPIPNTAGNQQNAPASGVVPDSSISIPDDVSDDDEEPDF